MQSRSVKDEMCDGYLIRCVMDIPKVDFIQ